MRQFKNFAEMLSAPDKVRHFIAKVIRDAKEPFEEALGGDVFLVETEKDLEELTIDYLSGANALQTAGQIDLAMWTDKSKSYAIFFSATNQAGGPGYFVPASIVNAQPNLLETIRLSKGEQK